MIKKTGNKIKLGIFISLGLLLLIVGIYFIGEGQQLFRSTFSVTGVFKDVAGLQAGNNVRLSGVNVGTVRNIIIVSDTSVRVEILIDERIREFIKKDAVAIIGSEGLMGNKALIINPGTGNKQVIENNDIIQTIQPVTIDDIIQSLNSTIENTASITGDLAIITKKIESGEGTIGRLIMDKKWRENFETTFINLREGSTDFRKVMAKANELDEIILSVKETIQNTADITSDLASISGNIESGRGTLGRFLMDQTTADNLDSTIFYLKNGAKGLNLLLKKAKSSWLLWGF
ncbi:vpsc protein [hydrocarbon metagenome]|uniref:Vpsc protein n=1 Tax=hydrocarbon metagenome TaxID=938273 RepID=A0A0W8FXM2_9ZZZZ